MGSNSFDSYTWNHLGIIEFWRLKIWNKGRHQGVDDGSLIIIGVVSLVIGVLVITMQGVCDLQL